MCKIVGLAIAAAALLCGQAPDAAYAPLEKAYSALRTKQYDTAIAAFRDAIAVAPERASIHKDLAYTLLKVGENDSARYEFSEAMRLDPRDAHVALEFAFLSYEAREQALARRIFDRIRKTGDAESRATAAQAFDNIDRPLAEGIARWRQAIALDPGNFSAHQELARLADQRDDFELAAEHYEKAWTLKREDRTLLLDLGRAWKAMGRMEDSNAALLAASRGPQPRAAEVARDLSPRRYPYVYEFHKAIELDPKNLDLRRELAYLLLEMNQKNDAEDEFRAIVDLAPDDLLSVAQLGFLRLARKDTAGAMPLLEKVLKGGDEELADRVRTALKLPQTLQRRADTPRNKVGTEARELAERSLNAGYLKDALKYLRIAHESDPVDFAVILKLGWTYNILKQDLEAVKWFNLARKSPDPAIAAEAERAYHNLSPQFARFRTTAWVFPFYSSRWKDMFTYGQAKTEIRIGKLPFRPYISARFIGDTRGETVVNVQPQYLSESSVILGVGASTPAWHGLNGWFEAGEAMKYLGSRKDVGAMVPDYRGGLSFARGFGQLLNGSSGGVFAETNDDGVYISRFNNDMLLYSQNRVGVTMRPNETLGFQAQFYWNANITLDQRGEYWANTVEVGPGVRFRFSGLPQSLLFSVNALRGGYLIRDGAAARPAYYDLRAGFWYAFTH